MTSPYRIGAKNDAAQPVETLECWLRDGDRGRWIRAVYVKGAISLLLACMAVAQGGSLATPFIAIGGILWAARSFRERNGARVVLTVRKERLRIEGSSLVAPIDIPLAELHDVRLDTKASSKNMTVARADGVNSIFGASSSHNIAVDVSRIEVLMDGEHPELLSPEFISGSLCTETMRTIRLFLRGHGWQPLDERSDEAQHEA